MDWWLNKAASFNEQALGIKERCPMDYMACIEEHFWRATGLRDFTKLIKLGSYYHGLVAQQGRLL